MLAYPLQTLLDGLASTAGANYSVRQHHETKELSHLFILSPSAKQICQAYSRGKIWLIDATYKTNRYGLPLLHVVGLTATNSTFTLCYCFMRNGTVADDRCSMSKLSEVFQNFGIEHQYQTLTFITDRDLALMTLQNISKFWYIALQVAYQQE